VNLFQYGPVRLASGVESNFKIECDALTDDDWECLAAMIADRVPSFDEVVGVPTGGEPLAQALKPYCLRNTGMGVAYRLLVVDDVWTTGRSMMDFCCELEHERQGPLDIKQAVVFARTSPPLSVMALFRMHPPQR